VFAAGGVSVSRTGPFDVWLSGTSADGQRRTVKETSAGAVSRTSALWVSPDCRAIAPGRLDGGQTPDSTVASRRRASGAAEQTQNHPAWFFHWVADDGDASEPCLDMGLHCGCDRAWRVPADADHSGRIHAGMSCAVGGAGVEVSRRIGVVAEGDCPTWSARTSAERQRFGVHCQDRAAVAEGQCH